VVDSEKKHKSRAAHVTVIHAVTEEDKERAMEQLATPKQKNSMVHVLDGGFIEVEVGLRARPNMMAKAHINVDNTVCPVIVRKSGRPVMIQKLAKFLSTKLTPEPSDPQLTPEKPRHKRNKSHEGSRDIQLRVSNSPTRSPTNSRNPSPRTLHSSADNSELKLGKLLDIDFPTSVPTSQKTNTADMDLLSMEERVRLEKEADTSLDIIYDDRTTFEDSHASHTNSELPQIKLDILQMDQESSDSESSQTPRATDKNTVQSLLRELSFPSVDVVTDARRSGVSSSDDDVLPPQIQFAEFDDLYINSKADAHLQSIQVTGYFNLAEGENPFGSSSEVHSNKPPMIRHSTTDLHPPRSSYSRGKSPPRSISSTKLKNGSQMDDRLIRLLEELHLEKYIDVFIEEEWDWDSLLEVTNSDLVDMGLKAGSRRKLMSAIQRVREQELNLRNSDPALPNSAYVNIFGGSTNGSLQVSQAAHVRKSYEIDFDELTVTQYLGKGFYGNVFLVSYFYLVFIDLFCFVLFCSEYLLI
jgi:hypothetical protein